MRKAFALIFVLALITAISIGFIGCAGGGNQAAGTTVDPAAAVVGKYYLTSMESEGELITMDYLADEAGLDPNEHYMELKDGGVVYITLFDDESDGTFTINGNIISITIDEETNDATLDGKKITLDFNDGGVMTFESKDA